MCRDCGCGLPGEDPVGIDAGKNSAHTHEHHPEHEHGDEHTHSHEHVHGPGHHHGEEHTHSHSQEHGHGHGQEQEQEHAHSHTHEHGHEHTHSHSETEAAASSRRTLEIRQAILEKNERLAERNRGFFLGRGLLVLNVLSSPGSGKTTLLGETLRALNTRFKGGVIAGDLATDNDARRLRESGAPVVQITTGTLCHLEAEMIGRALHEMDLTGLKWLAIENVGNLVCPAAYDLGETLRVVLLSVTEGEDKPLKYPPMFQSADVVLITKIDLAGPCGFNREAALANIRSLAPQAKVLEVSSKTGQGMEGWFDFLMKYPEASHGGI